MVTLRERIRKLEQGTGEDEKHELIIYRWLCEGHTEGPDVFEAEGERCPAEKKQYDEQVKRENKTLHKGNASYIFLRLFCQGCKEVCSCAVPEA